LRPFLRLRAIALALRLELVFVTAAPCRACAPLIPYWLRPDGLAFAPLIQNTGAQRRGGFFGVSFGSPLLGCSLVLRRSRVLSLRIRRSHRIPRGHFHRGWHDGREHSSRLRLQASQWIDSLRPLDGDGSHRSAPILIQPDVVSSAALSAIPYFLRNMNRGYRRLSNTRGTERRTGFFPLRDSEEYFDRYHERSSDPEHPGEASQGICVSEKHRFPYWRVLCLGGRALPLVLPVSLQNPRCGFPDLPRGYRTDETIRSDRGWQRLWSPHRSGRGTGVVPDSPYHKRGRRTGLERVRRLGLSDERSET